MRDAHYMPRREVVEIGTETDVNSKVLTIFQLHRIIFVTKYWDKWMCICYELASKQMKDERSVGVRCTSEGALSDDSERLLSISSQSYVVITRDNSVTKGAGVCDPFSLRVTLYS